MADAPEEAAEMAAIASSLVLIIGTLSAAQIESMILAGRMANERRGYRSSSRSGRCWCHPFPDGYHKKAAPMSWRSPSSRVMPGEIGVIAGVEATVRGRRLVRAERRPAHHSTRAATNPRITVAVSGATDIVTDGKHTLLVENGHSLMGSISRHRVYGGIR